jgi:hypothetical protein
MTEVRRFQSFGEFYPYYLQEHSRKGTRILHFFSSGVALGFASLALYYGHWFWAPMGLVVCYGLAWISHFFIEKNRPATFQYPVYSFISDFRLFFELLIGRQRF